MVTLSQVKTVIGITNKDKQISELIPLVYDFLENYKGWTDLTVIKLIEYHLNKVGVSSESLSRHSVTYETDIPKSVMKGVYRKGRFL